MTERPRCYFGFRSPYSRLGLHKLARAGIDADLHPFKTPEGAVFQDPAANPLKRDYYGEDVLRMTARMDLPLAMPTPFDVDFALANAAFYAAKEAGAGLAFAIAVSDARWGRGLDISDGDVIAACADEAGAPDPRGYEPPRSALEETQDLIIADKVFGVPFLVAGGARYWGQDRFDLFLEECAANA